MMKYYLGTKHTIGGIIDKTLPVLAGLGLIGLGLGTSLMTGCGPQEPAEPDVEETEEIEETETSAREDGTSGPGGTSTSAAGSFSSNGANSTGQTGFASGAEQPPRTASGSIDYQSARTWTDTQGREMEAQLVEFTKDKVILRDQVGRMKTIPREALSLDDDDFIDLIDMTVLPKFEPAEDAPEFFKIIDTIDGQVIVNAAVKSYGRTGVTLVHNGGAEVHLPYNQLNKSHLRKIGFPVETLEPEAIATTGGVDNNGL